MYQRSSKSYTTDKANAAVSPPPQKMKRAKSYSQKFVLFSRFGKTSTFKRSCAFKQSFTPQYKTIAENAAQVAQQSTITADVAYTAFVFMPVLSGFVHFCVIFVRLFTLFVRCCTFLALKHLCTKMSICWSIYVVLHSRGEMGPRERGTFGPYDVTFSRKSHFKKCLSLICKRLLEALASLLLV